MGNFDKSCTLYSFSGEMRKWCESLKFYWKIRLHYFAEVGIKF
jgi:hypothetical protein